MLAFYLILFLIPFYKIKFAGKNFYTEESLSKDATDSIKGFFIWLVFLSHFSGYVTSNRAIDDLGFKISGWLGQLIVACFFFYSGYGICESISKRGHGYIKALPKNRFFKTLLHFDLAVCLYIIINLFIGQNMSAKDILLGLIGWEGLGNSNWYIFVILAMYLITWAAFSIIKNNNKAALILTTIFSFGLIVIFYYTRFSWWYDTLLCYVFGMWLSVYKQNFFNFITKNNLLWGISFSVSFLIFIVIYLMPSTLIGNLFKHTIMAPFFCLIVTILLTKFTVSNKLLINSGRYLFEFYILQRIPMIIFKEVGICDFNLYIYFVLCIIVTIVLSLLFRKCLTKLDRVVFKSSLKR